MNSMQERTDRIDVRRFLEADIADLEKRLQEARVWLMLTSKHDTQTANRYRRVIEWVLISLDWHRFFLDVARRDERERMEGKKRYIPEPLPSLN